MAHASSHSLHGADTYHAFRTDPWLRNANGIQCSKLFPSFNIGHRQWHASGCADEWLPSDTSRRSICERTPMEPMETAHRTTCAIRRGASPPATHHGIFDTHDGWLGSPALASSSWLNHPLGAPRPRRSTRPCSSGSANGLARRAGARSARGRRPPPLSRQPRHRSPQARPARKPAERAPVKCVFAYFGARGHFGASMG